jgi:hypothetical protein
MGLKGYRLWVMGQLDSTCRAPPRRSSRALARPAAPRRSAAVQVAFVKANFETRFSLYRLEG